MNLKYTQADIYFLTENIYGDLTSENEVFFVQEIILQKKMRSYQADIK